MGIGLGVFDSFQRRVRRSRGGDVQVLAEVEK